jgi:hypothetical protein
VEPAVSARQCRAPVSDDLSVSPVCGDLVGKGRHPVVGQNSLERLPNDERCILSVSDGDEHVGAMDDESLPTDPAGAEDHRPATRLAMQTHRRDDGPAQPESRTVRLGLVADRDCGIDRVGRGTGQDRSVVEQHRCCAVVIVVVETLAEQRPAYIDRRREIGLIHDRDVTELARGWPPVARPKAASMSARPALAVKGQPVDRSTAALRPTGHLAESRASCWR